MELRLHTTETASLSERGGKPLALGNAFHTTGLELRQQGCAPVMKPRMLQPTESAVTKPDAQYHSACGIEIGLVEQRLDGRELWMYFPSDFRRVPRLHKKLCLTLHCKFFLLQKPCPIVLPQHGVDEIMRERRVKRWRIRCDDIMCTLTCGRDEGGRGRGRIGLPTDAGAGSNNV